MYVFTRARQTHNTCLLKLRYSRKSRRRIIIFTPRQKRWRRQLCLMIYSFSSSFVFHASGSFIYLIFSSHCVPPGDDNNLDACTINLLSSATVGAPEVGWKNVIKIAQKGGRQNKKIIDFLWFFLPFCLLFTRMFFFGGLATVSQGCRKPEPSNVWMFQLSSFKLWVLKCSKMARKLKISNFEYQ